MRARPYAGCMKLLVGLGVLLVASSAGADTISLDPVSGAVGFTGKNLGDWSITYERRLAPQHALVIEQATVHVHDDPFHLTTLGLGFGYRHFVRPSGSTPFVGALAGPKLGFGRFGDHGSITAHAVFATAHAGWRWVTDRLVVTARIGAGYGYYHVVPPDHDGIEHDVMADDHLKPLPFELDSELAIGWSF
jgi:hypothetical protein